MSQTKLALHSIAVGSSHIVQVENAWKLLVHTVEQMRSPVVVNVVRRSRLVWHRYSRVVHRYSIMREAICVEERRSPWPRATITVVLFGDPCRDEGWRKALAKETKHRKRAVDLFKQVSGVALHSCPPPNLGGG